MKKTTMKEDRVVNAAQQPRVSNPCVACITKIAKEGITSANEGCHFPEEGRLTRGFHLNGTPFKKCGNCIAKNKECYELPMSLNEDREALEDAVLDALAPVETTRPVPGKDGGEPGVHRLTNLEITSEKRRRQETVMQVADDLIKSLNSDGFLPYAENLQAHTGSKDSIGESGVLFKKRPRSKLDIARENELKRRVEEIDPADEEALLRTPKKARYGARAVIITNSEKKRRQEAAEEAERLEEERAERAKAMKIRAKRKKTNLEKAWLEKYDKDQAERARVARRANPSE